MSRALTLQDRTPPATARQPGAQQRQADPAALSWAPVPSEWSDDSLHQSLLGLKGLLRVNVLTAGDG